MRYPLLSATATRLLLFILLILTLFSCGGGGTPSTVITDAKVRILWPARTRDNVPAPGSAMSCHVFIEGGGVTGANVDVYITRDSNTSLHYGEYPIGTPMTTSTRPFTSTFFAEPDQNGDVVGLAHGFVTNGVFKDIVLDQTVKSVKIIPPTTFQVSATPKQMVFEANGVGNTVVAVLPGSDHWSIVSGSGNALSPSGLLTASTVGTLGVKVTVDGISSTTTPVTITDAPVDQVTYEVLSQSGAANSRGMFIGADGFVGGYFNPSATPVQEHAAFWVDGVRQDVNPPNCGYSYIVGGSGSVGVGHYAKSVGVYHAALFTTGGIVDIDPTGQYSAATAISGTTIVGQSGRKACKWEGDAHTFVDLHPGGWRESYATGVANDVTVGWSTNSPNPGLDALMWTGANNDKVVLTPSSFGAKALCASLGTQGGFFVANTQGHMHACIWHGSADSYVDLNPSFAGASNVNALLGDVAVGWYVNGAPNNDGIYRACMWNGSPSKFVNLKNALPSSYGSCQAMSIVAEPGGYAVAGWATTGGSYQAIVWHVPASLLN